MTEAPSTSSSSPPATKRRYSCLWCSLYYSRRTELMTHIKQCHEEMYAESCGTSNDAEDFRCVYCGERFAQLSSFMGHVKKSHKDYSEALSKPEYFKHKCLWCDHKFNKLSYLMSHIESDHPDQYTEAQNSKCLDRSKKEQILREGLKDERPASSSSSTSRSPPLDPLPKNNNEKEPCSVVQAVAKMDNAKRTGVPESTVSEPKKFKKPRLHALDDITKDERNPPPEPKESEQAIAPETQPKDTPVTTSVHLPVATATSSDTGVPTFQTPLTQFLAPKHKFQVPSTAPPGCTSDVPPRLFASPLVPGGSVSGSSALTKLKEPSPLIRSDRHDELFAPRPRGRPSKLATIMGFPGSALMDGLPSSVGGDGRGSSSGQYKCFWCDQTFKMRGRLMDHIDQQHKLSKEQQDKEASASLKQKLNQTDMAAPMANSANGWPPSGGPFVAPSWPHTLPIPGYFFPQFNGLDYMYGRGAAFGPPQQPTFPGPVPVTSLVPNANAVPSCKFFKLGKSKTRLTSCRIRASDILRKQSRSCRFFYLRLRDCGNVFQKGPQLEPACCNACIQDDEPTITPLTGMEPPMDSKHFFQHPFLPDPRLRSMPWMSAGGRRASVPILPLNVQKIKQEPSDDFASMAAFAASSRYGRRGSLPLDLRNPMKTPDHGLRRSREYPL